MTFKSNFFLLVENFIIDDRQRPSLINLYEILWAPQFPATHPLLKYVANVRVMDSKASRSVAMKVELTDEKGKVLAELATPQHDIMPEQKQQNMGMVLELQSVTFPAPGKYTATLLVEGKAVADHTLELREVPQNEA